MPPKKEHSCTQSERILTLELNQKTMAIDVSDIKKEVKEINVKFDTLIEKIDQKYAAKWTELAMKRAIWIILWIVLSAMVYTVIIK